MKKNIKTKIVISAAGLLLMMSVIIAVGIIRVSNINDMLTTINDINSVQQRYVINFRGSVHDRSIRLRDYVLTDSDSDRSNILSEMRKLEQFYDESAVALDKMMDPKKYNITSEETKLLNDIKSSESKVNPCIQKVIKLCDNDNFEEAQKLLMKEARPGLQLWLDRINAFIDYEEAENNVLTTETRAIASDFRKLMIFIGILSLIIGVVISIWTIRSVTPLATVAKALNDIADGAGDLTAEIKINSKDEVGKVANNFNRFVATLHKIISTVKNSVEGLASTSNGMVASMDSTQHALDKINIDITRVREQMGTQSSAISNMSDTVRNINGNVKDLTGLIQQQTTSVNDSTSSVEQMVNSVQAVTDALEKSQTQFNNLSQVSEIGFQKIAEVQEQVQEISVKSQSMSEANAVINNIASQTNLLAMNAAIEAAHAGESGKGFAVVADEIRKLAEIASTQSKSISTGLKDLVGSIGEVVDKSNILVHSFEDVRNAIDVVVDEQQSIRTVMEEQHSGNMQVKTSFETIQDLSNRVYDGIMDMYNGSQTIMGKTEDLVNITSDINTSMNNMTNNTTDIARSVGTVISLGKTTEQGVKNVKSEIDRFVL